MMAKAFPEGGQGPGVVSAQKGALVARSPGERGCHAQALGINGKDYVDIMNEELKLKEAINSKEAFSLKVQKTKPYKSYVPCC